ncbi:glycosyltransferase [Zobellella maritima]|uniref:glycosyltransferase n=1 Tax=Zobellella maritima TaxID=2059725 RepID=UPI000E30080F|nr:glycosyltransferase [Zobellella maritima]
MERLFRWLQHHLSTSGPALPPVPANFDGSAYLLANPDVAAAGMDAWTHYCRYGRAEQRPLQRNRALIYEHHLWRGLERQMQPLLQALLQDSEASEQERHAARWALARWAAWQGSWSQVVRILQSYCTSAALSSSGPGAWLLLATALQHTHQPARALTLLQQAQAQLPRETDLLLAQANLLASSAETQLALLNMVFNYHGLAEVDANPSATSRLDSLHAGTDLTAAKLPSGVTATGATVTVIIPVHNAADVIGTALRALAEQTWPYIELLLVDDASSDNTLAVVHRWLTQHPLPPGKTLQVLKQTVNGGAYAARNIGLEQASGAFITTHDSDDWSHPQKIEHQVRTLLAQPNRMASISFLVRATPRLQFGQWRAADRWTERNESSLMLRRAVVAELGCWDEVRVAADTEYLLRIQAAYGTDSVVEVLPQVPLAIGRLVPSSLTQNRNTHLVTQFTGVRKHYIDAACRWHARTCRPQELFLSANPAQRPFAAPSLLCRKHKVVGCPDRLDTIQQSDWFDGVWYCSHYADLQQSTCDPVWHYCRHGAFEGRDPGPLFSTTGYAAFYSRIEQPISTTEALLHFLSIGQVLGYQACPHWAGDQPEHHNRPWVLVCGHRADQQVYGAERCLLDVLAALSALQLNVLVTLPSALNPDYVAAVRRRCRRLVILPYGWWHADRPACVQTVALFAGLMKQYSVSMLLANTLVLDEPLLAARQCDITIACYVHELIASDTELCAALGSTPAIIRQRVASLADMLLASSRAVADDWPHTPSVVVPNVVNVADYNLPITCSSRVHVALLSNNLPNKGVQDFVRLAQRLADNQPAVQCLLIGPETAAVSALKCRRDAGSLPDNLVLMNYMPTTTALAQADIVLNLSHVQESFGRTLLEAMAAGKPVIGYRWGALSELVIDGENGFLLPLGDIGGVAERITQLASDAAWRRRMGNAGRRRVERLYSPEVMQAALAKVCQALTDECY